MGFFKRRKTGYREKFSFKFVPYGEKPEEFCIFAGMENPDIQKRERVWVSWEAVERILNERGAIQEFAFELKESSDKFVEEELKKRFGV